MKRYIKTAEVIVAMSTINPKFCKNNNIQVEVEQRDEGPIPHMHVYHDKTRDPKKCSYVRLDLPQYSTHHGEESLPLPKDVKEKFIKVMSSPWPGHYHECADGTVRVATGYEAAVDTWVDTYEDDYRKFQLDDNGDLIQLDYSVL